MQAILITNGPVGAGTVQDTLLPLIDRKKYDRISVAVSYVKYTGVMSIHSKLKRFIRAGGEVRLLFGDDFRLSQSRALRKLLRIGVNLRLFVGQPGQNYHPKVWIFEGRGGTTSLTGSSNLSRGALTSNIEANIFLAKSQSVTDDQSALFNFLWKNSSQGPIDDEWIDHYVDAERSRDAEFKYTKSGSISYKKSYDQLSGFIDGWVRHIRKGGKIGQYERWRGWYFIPEPATMDESRMVEFQRILLAINASTQYKSRRALTLTENATNEVLRKARVKYKGTGRMTLSAKGRRDLFIRQQKDYLGILGFIETVDSRGPQIAITPLGVSLMNSKSSIGRRRIFTKALRKIRWRWAPKLRLLDFTVALMENLPKRRLYFHELSLFVIHAEHNVMFRPILNLLRMFRWLPRSQQTKLIRDYTRKLERRLSKRNKWAYYRYRRKIKELLALLGYAEGVEYCDATDDSSKYIELKGGSIMKGPWGANLTR